MRDLGGLTGECELRGLDLEETPASAAHGCFLARSLIQGSLLLSQQQEQTQQTKNFATNLTLKMVSLASHGIKWGKAKERAWPRIDGNEAGK